MSMRNDDQHPDAERVPLTWGEQRRWVRFVNAELRHDAVSLAARKAIAKCLDACSEPGMKWCGCPDHTTALEEIVEKLWGWPTPSP